MRACFVNVDIYIYNYVCGMCVWGGRQPVRGWVSKRVVCSSGEDLINSAILLFDFNFRILLSWDLISIMAEV